MVLEIRQVSQKITDMNVYVFRILTTTFLVLLYSCSNKPQNRNVELSESEDNMNGNKFFQKQEVASEVEMRKFSFEEFRFLFLKEEAPLVLDKIRMEQEVYAEDIMPIPLDMVRSFLMLDEDSSRANLLVKLYEFYPLFEITFTVSSESTNDKVYLIFLKKGSAGGVEDRFNLLMFDQTANSLSSIEVGHIWGDCSFTDVMEASFERLGIILSTRYKLNTDCESGIIREDTAWLSTSDTIDYFSAR